ncbi:MAG: sigma factor-like helix-turn-helix DNA-binding protein [Acidimicrobiales bacterium]
MYACRSTLRRRKLASRLRRVARSEATVEHDYLLDALDQLPARQTITVVLRYYELATEAEIAHALGCSPVAAKALLRRGLTDLRRTVTTGAYDPGR